jgi:hypothetical protein
MLKSGNNFSNTFPIFGIHPYFLSDAPHIDSVLVRWIEA